MGDVLSSGVSGGMSGIRETFVAHAREPSSCFSSSSLCSTSWDSLSLGGS